MNFDKLIARVRNILLDPKAEWPVIAAEPATVPDLYRNYIAILAAIPAVFGFIKTSIIGTSALGVTFRLGIGAGLAQMVLGYALSLGVTYLMALLIDALAPSFGAEKNPIQALKTAAYAYTASWVAGVAMVIPWLGGLVVIAGGIYGIYLIYLGVPHTMKAPPERAGSYTAVIVVVGIVLGLVVGGVIGLIGGAGAALGGASALRSGDATISVDPDSRLGKLAALGEKMEAANRQMEAAQKSGDAQAQAEAAGKLIGTVMSGGDQVDPLAPDRLKAFVPNSLAGLKRSGLTLDRSGALGLSVSQARANYSDDQGHSLDLEIVDTGSAKGLMALGTWASVESERQTDSGYEKTYKLDGRLAHEQWDRQSKHGEFTLVLGERFSVKISGSADNIDDIRKTLGSLDLSGLEALKNEGVKRG